MTTDDLRCLVTGATGYIGSRLVPQLLDRGHRVRAMARNPDKLSDAPWRDDVEVIRGDLNDADSLLMAFDDVDVVYYLVHSMGTSKDFVDAEKRAAKNVVSAARRAGVRRIVYLGGLHPTGVSLSRHLQSRTDVGDILIDSDIETLVLQAGVVVGSGSASFEMIRHLTNRLPVMTTPKWVHNKIQPIAVRDALHYLSAAATAEVATSRTWDIGGTEVFEYGDMMQIYADVAGLRRRRIVVLPFLTPTIASWWVGLVTPIPPGLARPLVESLECDAVMAEHDIDDLVPPPAAGLTRYKRAVELSLNNEASGQMETSLPSDPDWAGELVYCNRVSATSAASPDELWKAAETAVDSERWTVESREPGHLLRLHAANSRAPGGVRLELRVTPVGTGSEYEQLSEFAPRGLAGQLYWLGSWPIRAVAQRVMAKRIIKAAG